MKKRIKYALSLIYVYTLRGFTVLTIQKNAEKGGFANRLILQQIYTTKTVHHSALMQPAIDHLTTVSICRTQKK